MSYQKTVGTLMAWGYQKLGTQEAMNDMYITDSGGGTEQMETVVRRLTPTECERLQNFPDGWTDIGDWVDEKGKTRKTTDSARYKALGNSIALPFWFWLLRRISAEYETPATMGSLFSGIGGFDLAWSRCNGSGSVLWSSEIEKFPIAVMKKTLWRRRPRNRGRHKGVFMKLPTDFILHIEPRHNDIEATWQGQLVRCKDCQFNYGNEHNCGFNPEDILCTYWESDGLNADDFCSQGLVKEINKSQGISQEDE